MSIRGFFAAAIAFLVLSMPVSASAGSRPALITEEAGFTQAKTERVTIGVERDDWLAPAMRYWNDRAGWQLLAFSDTPQITTDFKPTCTSCSTAYSAATDQVNPNVAYGRCEISIKSSLRDIQTVAHEMGHCLGLRHQLKGVMMYTTATKILSGWKSFDHGLMVEAGYADAP